MELVYLWVDSYKNIKKQGFNFSPRFSVEFKPEYEEKMCCNENKKKLSIKEDCRPTFTKSSNFKEIDLLPKNINITAIVGENGSGKTAILHELLNVGDIEKNKRTKIYAYNKETDKVEYISHKTLHKNKTQVLLFEEDRDSLSYNNAYSVNGLIGIKDDDKRNNAVIALLGYDKNQYDLKNLSFMPTHLELALTNAVDVDLYDLLTLRLEIEDIANDTSHPLSFSQNDIHQLKQFLQKELSSSIIEYNNSTDISHYMYIKAFCYQLYERDNASIEILKELFISNYRIDNFAEKLSKEIFSLDNKKEFIQKIEKINKIFNNKLAENKFVFELENNSEEIELILLNANQYFFKIDFFKIINQKNIYFKHLSSGEQKLVVLFGKLNYVVRTDICKNKDDFILLLDEPDIYLNPNWQKKLISYFINFIQNNKVLNKKNIHIVISSHSPFILSDLAKENVIFLKDGKQVDVDMNPFGANIHTLLSHGFFMKDGLMGEFAKNKINEVIKILKKKRVSKKNLDYCKNIISIIGEPILKSTLQDMLDKKLYPEESKLEKLKRQQKEIKEAIKQEEKKGKSNDEN